MINFCIKAFAKINLGINVLGKMQNGYHKIDMILHAIELADIVTVSVAERSETSVKLEISGMRQNSEADSALEIPIDDRNLAVKAARLFFEKTGKALAIDIRLEKKIPIAAGLAGGSSDAAAVLLSLNKLLDTRLSLKELAAIGSEIGADVAFCIYANALGNPEIEATLSRQDKEFASFCMRAENKGELLSPLNCVQGKLLLLKPPFGLSTKEVYEGFDELSVDEVAFVPMDKMVEAIKNRDCDAIWNYAANALEGYSCKRFTEISRLKRKIIEKARASLVMMSGSGPTIFAIYDSEEKRDKDFSEFKDEGMLLLKTELSGRRSWE